MDSATEFLFGKSANSQLTDLQGSTSSDDGAAFVTAFDKCLNIIAEAFLLNDWYSIGLSNAYYESCKVCHQYIHRFVQEAIDHEKEKDTIARALAAQTQDPVEIRDQLVSILAAGRDTTASFLSFILLALAENQDVFDKLRKIVMDDFGTYKRPRNITFSNLKSCSYLQWCLNETLRLFPTVAMNSRRSVRVTTLPRGGGSDGLSPVFVPKDTEVNYSVYPMHRNTAFWGLDAEKFIPERWNGRKTGFEYLPFNGGPR
jgi:cytochrome P450